MKKGWLAVGFGFREPTSLALSGYGGAQRSPYGNFAGHRTTFLLGSILEKHNINASLSTGCVDDFRD